MAIDLRPWGYAPGGYTFKCIDCPPDTDPMSQWAAKRAWRCEKHALEARYNSQQQTRPACPSCNGLNTACPEGCGRDPKTGELDGSTLESAPAAGAQKSHVDGSIEWPVPGTGR